jgi:hypothetical protein
VRTALPCCALTGSAATFVVDDEGVRTVASVPLPGVLKKKAKSGTSHICGSSNEITSSPPGTPPIRKTGGMYRRLIRARRP